MAPGKSGAGLGETLREREEPGATGRREEGRGDLLGASIDGDLLRPCPADASGGARLRGAPQNFGPDAEGSSSSSVFFSLSVSV